MLQTLFYFILNTSLNAAFIICAVLLIRSIRAIPRKLVYIFWAAAFIRLCLPFSLSSRWSIFNYTGGLIKRVIAVDSFLSAAPLPGMTVANFIGAADTYAPAGFKTDSLHRLFTAGAVIWLAVSIAALLAVIILYMLSTAALKKAMPLQGNVYLSDNVRSPVLKGVFRPEIILPASLDIDSIEAKLAIAHENVHRKRLDNLWRLLALVIVCLHWFNPFAWVMLKYFLTDMELSCDEAVLRKQDPGLRASYASALVSFAGDSRFYMQAALGKSNIKLRVVNILNYKQFTPIGTAVSVLFLIIAAVVLITNPQLRG